jgi:ABC-type branched-subunit amino acid transport system substrate-binding protein
MKKILLLVVVLFGAMTLSACFDKKVEVQGVTETTIKIGNTAAATGDYGAIGIPFNAGMRAVFKQVNEAGGIGGRTIEFITYDDAFDPAKGKTYTETLMYDDEVFAIVGHFGTPTVGATVDIIQEYGIPMVYAATGIQDLFFEKDPGNPILAVQPIYHTEGRTMTARAIKEALYGPAGDQKLGATDKIGVLYTNDDVGNAIKAGIEVEAKELNREASFTYEAISSDTASTAANKLKTAGVKVVLLAMNQAPFAYTLSALHDVQLNVPVITSYVNADVKVVDHTKTSLERPIYTNAWVDVFSVAGYAAYTQYVTTIMASDLDAATKTDYALNSFAIAGYIAATIFVEGLKRVEESQLELTWKNYIEAMEGAPIQIPMGGTLDFSDGKRWGIDALSLLKYSYTLGDNPATTDVVETDFLAEAFAKVREIEILSEIEAKN